MTEPCMMSGCPLGTHNASIAGHRSGGAVSFVKRTSRLPTVMTPSLMKVRSMLKRVKSMGAGGCQALRSREHF